MSTLEDKILDGPRVHYCEDGDDDVREEGLDELDDESGFSREKVSSLFERVDEEDQSRKTYSSPKTSQANKLSRNTGPKGVIEDFKKQSADEQLEEEFKALMNDDSFLKEFIPRRFQSNQENQVQKTFGRLLKLETGSQLLDEIDNESQNVLVIVHIYSRFSKPCKMLNKCLEPLAEELQTVKFLTLDASVTGLSQNFKDNGVPAVLAYKAGQLIKSIVQFDEFLDKTFDANDIKDILRDNGLI